MTASPSDPTNPPSHPDEPPPNGSGLIIAGIAFLAIPIFILLALFVIR